MLNASALLDQHLEKVLRWCLYGLALTLPISIAISSIFYFSALALFILCGKWTLRRWPVMVGRIEIAFIAFLLFSIASAFHGQYWERSFGTIGSDMYFLMLPLLGALVFLREEREKLLIYFLIGSLVASLYGLLQWAIGIDEFDTVLRQVPSFMEHWPRSILKELAMINGRVVGTRSHPLTYAEGLLFALAYAMVRLFFAPRHSGRWAIACLLLLSSIVVSQSRGPWLAVLAMGGIFLLCVPFKTLFKRGWVLLLPLGLVFITANLRDRAVSITDLKYGSNSERIRMWKAGAEITRDHPWLGAGPGAMKFITPHYQSESDRSWGPWGHLHNTFINVLAERGWLGFFAFLWLLLSMMLAAVRWRNILPHSVRALLEGLSHEPLSLLALSSLVAFMVSGLTETVYNDTEVLMTFYFVLALCFSGIRRDHDTTKSDILPHH